MTLAATNQPLTHEEFERLADFLGSSGPAAMNIETLDGYFAALIAGPDMVMPSEYLSQIWGEDFSLHPTTRPATSSACSCVTGTRSRANCCVR